MKEKRICISLGCNEHIILKLLRKEKKTMRELMYLMKDKFVRNNLPQYSPLGRTLIRMMDKSLIEWGGISVSAVLNESVEKRNHISRFVNLFITERGKLILQLFGEGK